MSDATLKNALANFEVDFARAIADLEIAIDDIVSADEDAESDILTKEADGSISVDASELRDLLERLADTPGAVTGAFEDFGWKFRKALRELKQTLARESAEG